VLTSHLMGEVVELADDLAFLLDGRVLLGVMLLGDYPLERPLIAAMLANPIDLARVLLIMQFDVSALMGYTGAVFEKFFGNGGIAVAIAALAAWVAAPVLLGARAFRKRDF
ncbi:MAG: ABC transporter permease, partial [Gemmatimonadaceae bacterium]|nr:ABC transporter permease [Gemmatimonadaceae bacterium]